MIELLYLGVRLWLRLGGVRAYGPVTVDSVVEEEVSIGWISDVLFPIWEVP